jgi:hypothetical protein
LILIPIFFFSPLRKWLNLRALFIIILLHITIQISIKRWIWNQVIECHHTL